MKIACSHNKIEEIHKLVPHPRNANKHPEKQIELLAKIIDHQGQRSPIVVSSRSGFITKGHGRLEAIKKLGWDTCAIDVQDYENEAQEFADLIADNKIAELAQHDDALMIDSLHELDIQDFELLGMPDFTLEVAEIEMPDLNSGEKSEIEQITFTLTAEQAAEVRNAMDKAKDIGPFGETGNENSNGNAIARVCEWFLNADS
jgi:hypothetical protein